MPSSVTILLAVLLVLVLATLVVAAFCLANKNNTPIPTTRTPTSTPHLHQPPRHKHWTVVGAGVAAAAFMKATENPSVFTISEAGNRAGGRALTTVPPITPVSTATAPREFAAWIFRANPGDRTTQFLRDIGVQSTSIDLVVPTSFIYTPDNTRVPFGVLPSTPFATAAADGTVPLWLAHTGFSPLVAPGASEDLVRAQDLPARAAVPTGFGWQDVVLRGIGSTPVMYGRLLDTVLPGADGRVTLGYASGDTQTVDGVVLTLTPRQMLQIPSLPIKAREAIETSFITVSEGVLYATWGGSTTWFTTVGFLGGVVMTSLPLGRMCHTNTGEVRCTMSGNANVEYWNNLLVVQGAEAAAAAMATQLRQVFGVDSIPPPDNMAFRGWHDAVGFWTVDATKRTVIQQALSRPWGLDVPIYWASSDLSTTPGWVEGAIESGQLTAAQVDKALCGGHGR
jgi:hypothetical protein